MPLNASPDQDVWWFTLAVTTFDDWLAQLSDMHPAEPSRILCIARAAGVLPEQVLVVGCQPGTCEDFAEMLSAPVAAAVPVAARRVRELLAELITRRTATGAPLVKTPGKGCRRG